MAADLTATAQIAAVRRDGMLGPSVDSAFPSNDDIAAFLNEEMALCLTPLLLKPREERFVFIVEGTTTVNEAEIFTLPAWAVWDDLRDVQMLVPGSSPESWVSLPPISPERAAVMPWPFAGWPNSPLGYYLQSDTIITSPPPQSAFRFRVKLYRRPGNIVLTGWSEYSAADVSGGNLVATVDSTAGMSTTNSLFSVLEDEYPWRPIVEGVRGFASGDTSVRFPLLTLSAADQAAIEGAVGTGIIIADGDAPGPQIPQDLIPLLTTRATYRALKAKRDPEWKSLLAAAEALEEKLVRAMTPRQDGLAQVVVVRNAPGYRGGYGGGWGRW